MAVTEVVELLAGSEESVNINSAELNAKSCVVPAAKRPVRLTLYVTPPSVDAKPASLAFSVAYCVVLKLAVGASFVPPTVILN